MVIDTTAQRSGASSCWVTDALVTDEARVINIPDDVVDRLRRHLNMRPIVNIGGHVVTTPKGGPLPYDRWRIRMWVKIVDLLDFEITAHDLHKTATTRLFVVDRWTPGEVQVFLGHSDPRMALQVYALIESEKLPQPSTMNTRSN
jgi:integrase